MPIALIIAILGAVGPVIASIGTLVAVIRGNKKHGADIEKVHLLVNSQLSGVKTDLIQANERIATLLRVREGAAPVAVPPTVTTV